MIRNCEAQLHSVSIVSFRGVVCLVCVCLSVRKIKMLQAAAGCDETIVKTLCMSVCA